MIMNKDSVLIWLTEFKCKWLPQNITNDDHLFHLLTNKINELERLLTPENEIPIEDNSECIITNEIDQSFVSLDQSHDVSLFSTPPDKRNPISEESQTTEDCPRPTIRIKRIPLAEAELYLPAAWKPTKSKRGRKPGKKRISAISSNGKKSKRNSQTNKLILSSTPDKNLSENTPANGRRRGRKKKLAENPSVSSLISNQSVNIGKKGAKRKLRAIDAEDDDLYTLGNLAQTDNLDGDINCDQVHRYIGQNGILSQTRKTSESIINSDDDFTIKLQSRQANKERLSIELEETIINNKKLTETPLVDGINIIEDLGRIDPEPILKNIMEHNDNESLFATLNLTHDRTFDTSSTIEKASVINYNDCIEDISNDGIEPIVPQTLPSVNLPHFSLTT